MFLSYGRTPVVSPKEKTEEGPIGLTEVSTNLAMWTTNYTHQPLPAVLEHRGNLVRDTDKSAHVLPVASLHLCFCPLMSMDTVTTV